MNQMNKPGPTPSNDSAYPSPSPSKTHGATGAAGTAGAATSLTADLRDIAFVLLPRFSMIGLMAALEPLRVANNYRPGTFTWRFVSQDGAAVAASNEIPVQASQKLGDIVSGDIFSGNQATMKPGTPDMAVICSSWEHQQHVVPGILNPLRALARRGTVLAAMDTGPFVLARAGLLEGRRVAVHWESAAAFRESFPHIETTNALYEIDRDRITCSGGAAALDMMLDIIEAGHGRDLAVAIADQLLHPRFAGVAGTQLPVGTRLQITNGSVAKIVEAMEGHMEDPLTNTQLAGIGGLSVRHMERLFQADFATTPRLFYQRLRLDHAYHLLRDARLGVLEAAIACGFRSHAGFTKAYRSRFGAPPSRHARMR